MNKLQQFVLRLRTKLRTIKITNLIDETNKLVNLIEMFLFFFAIHIKIILFCLPHVVSISVFCNVFCFHKGMYVVLWINAKGV